MKRLIAYPVAATLGIFVVNAHADWQPDLVDAEKVRSPYDDVRIQLPAEVTTDMLQWLALEINNIDVSEVVRLEESSQGFVIVVSPPKSLEPGSHRVRLVEYTPDGQIVERGRWAMLTGATTELADWSLDIDTTLDLGYRVDDAESDAGEDRGEDFQGGGSSLISARVVKDDWEVEADASMLYSSEGIELNNFGDDPRSGDDVDLGEYLISRRDELTQINLGHHAIDHDSLIMDDFYRRGASASASLPNGMATGTLFAMRAEPIIGRRNILGIEEVRSRIMGAVASVSPFAEVRSLTISVAGLSGKGDDENGTASAGRDVLAESDAVSISAESTLVNNKLHFRGEYAKTNYDFDGIDNDLEKIDDDARMLLVEYSPLKGKVLGDKPADLTFGAEYRQVGLFFKSIANSFLPADKDLQRVFSEFRWSGLYVSLSAGQEHDNVDNAADLARLNTDLHQLSASYSPPASYDDQGNLKTPWYGQPSFNGAFQHGRQEQVLLPTGFNQSIDRRTRTGRVSAGFYYPGWNWYVGHSVGLEDDLTLQSPDIQNRISDVGINVSFAERVYVGLQYQYNRIHESNGQITRTSLWSTNIDAELITDVLTGRLNYSMNLDRTTDDSLFSDNSIVNVELNWQIVETRDNRPGVALWLRGDYQDFDDRATSNNDSTTWQVFMGVSVDWPLSFAREN